MSTSIGTTFDQAWINTYETNLRHALQQMDSKLANAVEFGTMEGEKHRFTFIGAAEMHEVIDRMEKTVFQDTKFENRWVFHRFFNHAWMFDRNMDVKKMLTDPQSDKLKSAVAAARRQKDAVIIEAFDKTVRSGKDAEKSVAFDASTQEIGVQFGGSTNSGLTMKKLHELRARMDEAEVDPNAPQYLAISPRVLQKFLETEKEMSSSEYNSVKALINGDLNHFMGFEWIRTNMLKDTEGVRSCFAWSKPAIKLAVSMDVRLLGPTPHADYNLNDVYLVEMGFDAVRLYDPAVFRIQCDETV